MQGISDVGRWLEGHPWRADMETEVDDYHAFKPRSICKVF